MTIYVIMQSQPLEVGHRKRLEKELPGHAFIYGDDLPDADARRRAVESADIVFGNPPSAWVPSAPKLRWLQLDSAGIDAYLGVAAAGKVAVSNLSDFYSWAVSECALGAILGFFRRIPEMAVDQKAGLWDKDAIAVKVGQLRGAKVILLGAGGIGRRLASLLRPFEGEVLMYARRSAEATLRDPAALDAALPSADVVVNILPHSAHTAGFLGRERLARFKRGALFVNVGRGSAVDETALVDALNSGALGGAVLDVTAVEPLPLTSPLWKHPNVLLMQHTAGRFPGETDAKMDYFLANFRRFEKSEPLAGLVDAERGY